MLGIHNPMTSMQNLYSKRLIQTKHTIIQKRLRTLTERVRSACRGVGMVLVLGMVLGMVLGGSTADTNKQNSGALVRIEKGYN
jgi:hypothetical protein